ncbi:MAG: hypothetical protein OPY03_00075, partial [Nitrosopumilus sp.]|nr:hypothetical protein [Nitrosopumilus sp.]
NEAGDLGLYWFEYSVQKLSSLATEVREKINLDNKERRKRAKESPILTANNHLKLELFAQSDIAEKSYNKFTQPKVFRLEKDRKSLDDENRNWIKFGIFEDCKRLEQIFVQFPITDQVLFDNYMEISSDLQELKSARNDRHNLSKKLALAYDMIIIAKKVLPNKIQFVRREIESPDFGKLRIK